MQAEQVSGSGQITQQVAGGVGRSRRALGAAQTGDELRRARKGRSRWSQVSVASAFEAGGGKGKMPQEVG